MQGKSLIIDGILVNYFQEGDITDNMPIFLHGWGSQALHFKNILDKCSNFIAIDLPGFGKSNVPKKPFTIEDYSVFLKEFFSKLGIREPILIGHSLGGSIAIKYIVKFGNVKKIILISSAGIRRKNFKVYLYLVITKILKFIFYIPGLNYLRVSARKKYYDLIGAQDYIEAGELTDSFKNIIKEDLSDDMRKVNIETVLIWGDNDKDTPIKMGELIHSLIKNSKFFIIKNAGHFPFIDQPSEFNAIFFKEFKNEI